MRPLEDKHLNRQIYMDSCFRKKKFTKSRVSSKFTHSGNKNSFNTINESYDQ